MTARRKQIVGMGALVLVLAAVLAWRVLGRTDGAGNTPAPRPSATAAAPQPAAQPATPPPAAPMPQVALALLDHPRPEPADAGRDPFKFDARRARRPSSKDDDEGDDTDAPAGGRPAAGPVTPPVPQEPPGPPPPPPIPLKFIGLVQQAGSVGRIAVLSDGRGVYHGREGDIVEGRYRIVRIGNESIEMVYLDGRGRQVIRLSGA
jgi:hypothetical protein